jgi:hypothetical protein
MLILAALTSVPNVIAAVQLALTFEGEGNAGADHRHAPEAALFQFFKNSAHAMTKYTRATFFRCMTLGRLQATKAWLDEIVPPQAEVA